MSWHTVHNVKNNIYMGSNQLEVAVRSKRNFVNTLKKKIAKDPTKSMYKVTTKLKWK